MSRADELLVQYQKKIGKIGQWIAIRRYAGTGGVRTYADTVARAYIKYQPAKEFVGSVVQNYAVVISLVDTFVGMVPYVSTNDRLVTAFTGFDDLATAPTVNEESHVDGGKETAIFTIMKRAPGGKLIALEMHAVG